MRFLTRNTAIMVTAVFALVGCQTEQTGIGEMTEEIEETEEAGLEEQARIDLEAKNESGVTGDVTVGPLNGEIEVTARLTGADPATGYVWHLHRGDCAAGGPVAVDLGRIENSPEGLTEGTATIPRSQLTAGESYFIQVHSADQTAVACADAPELTDLATGTETPAGAEAGRTEGEHSDTY